MAQSVACLGSEGAEPHVAAEGRGDGDDRPGEEVVGHGCDGSMWDDGGVAVPHSDMLPAGE